MRKTHPLLRGLALAATFVLMMALLGTPRFMDMADLTRLSRPLTAFAGMAAAGAFIAAIPQRLRRLQEKWDRSDMKGCAAAFAGGLLAVLGLRLAGAGELQLICGAMQGGLGALAFVGCAWLAAVITVKATGRWLQ